jgi:hypothetical protein
VLKIRFSAPEIPLLKRVLALPFPLISVYFSIR